MKHNVKNRKDAFLLPGLLILLFLIQVLGFSQEPRKKTQVRAAIGGGASLKIKTNRPDKMANTGNKPEPKPGSNQFPGLTPGELQEDIIFNGTKAAEKIEPIQNQRQRLDETFSRLIQSIEALSPGNKTVPTENSDENAETIDSQGTSNPGILDTLHTFTETGDVAEPEIIKDKSSEYYSDLVKIDSELEETLKDAGSETIVISDDFPQDNAQDKVSVEPLPEKPEEADNDRLKRLEDKINELYEKLGNKNGDIVF